MENGLTWEKSVLARAIIEILGAPKEYLQEAMKAILEDIKKHDYLKVEREELFEPKESGKLFTSFMELELRFKNLEYLFGFCIDYLPASIEILEPERLEYGAAELTQSINDLLAKLHRIDAALKEKTAENEVLERNAMLLFRNNVIITLGDKKMKINEISRMVGISEEQLKPFLDIWIKEGFIKCDNDLYYV
ncbi:MAG: hypothetical protein QXW00_00540 [Candidatus Woesearchaeota archaeon]